MRKLSLLFLVSTLFTVPVFASSSDGRSNSDQAEIEQLKREVLALTEELNTMRMQYRALQTRLSNARNILSGNETTAASSENGLDEKSCFARLSELKQTQTKLKSMGYKDEHPDLRLVGMNIEKRTLECGPEETGP